MIASEVVILFPNQLFKEHLFTLLGKPVFVVEEFLFFKQYSFHKQKLCFHRASMKYYHNFLQQQGNDAHYINSIDDHSDIRKLLKYLYEQQVNVIHLYDPCDDWLKRRMISTAALYKISLKWYENPLFLNSRTLNAEIFAGKKKFLHNDFYVKQRKRLGILIDDAGEALAGQWSFDADNRKRFPKNAVAPAIQFPVVNEYYAEAKEYVDAHFSENLGEINPAFFYPCTHADASKWLQGFLHERFEDFGVYEDSLVEKEHFLHHSVLSPMLNAGLLSVQEVIAETIAYADSSGIPINSYEGFIRQVIGWREFIRTVYDEKGREERTKNYWQFHRKIPASFYNGTTGIGPVDSTIRKVLATGYCHHIERLMVLGNFMLLCEFDPDEVYRWFMELFIDAYDWVMVPNVYGMSQFADGGLMASKPYFSGSNYLIKMADYGKGDWQEIWDALFWNFMHKQRVFFSKNPRMGMLLKTFDKMPSEKRDALLEKAEVYLSQL
jgi:deoxyribodipyrimidine photolyase-related protein